MRFALVFAVISLFSLPAFAQTQRIVALGDSLTAGYGLNGGEDFASKLQEALIAQGYNVKIDNAGVSGDTSAGGKARAEWAVQGEPKPSLVILALGGNDMLRGIDPKITKDNLAAIIKLMQEKDIPVLLAGMKSPTNMGPFFQSKFDRIFGELAKEYDVPLLPFFLEGVAMKADLNQSDGIHPNQRGVAIMVENILPSVKKALKK